MTDQVPPEQRIGIDTVAGPPPMTIYEGAFLYPEPPQSASFAGTLLMTLDSAGFGHVSLTEVVLGTAQVDLGLPFGLQTVTITRVRGTGIVTVAPVTPGDVDRDDDVDVADLLALLAAWGVCPADPDPCGADFNIDSVVSVGDLPELLANWG